MPTSSHPFDNTKFINVAQVGGIEAYTIDEGPARGVRALLVNTGGGLRYRVLADRGLDIDQAFFNQHSLTFLSHKGVTPPNADALQKGLDWLKGFPVGLLTSCGPFNIGSPCNDQGEELGLHGPHSNTAAYIESVIQPDHLSDQPEMSITACLRYGAFYGPCVELRRRISSILGDNAIYIADEFHNAGNTEVPHQWLLHINFGYPLVDQGAEFCVDEQKVEPVGGSETSARVFRPGGPFKKIPAPLPQHSGPESYVGYLYPRPNRLGVATVAIVNRKLNLAVAVTYNTREFTRCANWQHWGKYEYVCALEPTTGSVEGRDKDRAAGILGSLKPGERKSYRYMIEAITDRQEIARLRTLNK